MNERHINAVSEERESTRFPKEPQTIYAAVWRVEGEEILAEVHNESLTGIALIVEPELGFQVGDVAHIAFAATVTRGTVRHLKLLQDGRVQVGFSCDLEA